jgi:hypothetical protein
VIVVTSCGEGYPLEGVKLGVKELNIGAVPEVESMTSEFELVNEVKTPRLFETGDKK